MLLRSALGMAIVMMLMGMAQNIWQFLLLRALLGLLGGFIPNANALIATQIPRHKSGWALGTLSTGAVSGALLGPLAGGFLADHWGLRTVFFMTAAVLFICFLFTLFLIRENFVPIARKEMLSAREVFSSLQNPKLVLSLFVTSLIIQVATGSIAPILTLYVRDLAAGQTGGSHRAGKNPHRRADYLGATPDPDVVRSDPAAVRYPAIPARRRGRRAAAGGANPAGVQLDQPDLRANLQL